MYEGINELGFRSFDNSHRRPRVGMRETTSTSSLRRKKEDYLRNLSASRIDFTLPIFDLADLDNLHLSDLVVKTITEAEAFKKAAGKKLVEEKEVSFDIAGYKSVLSNDSKPRDHDVVKYSFKSNSDDGSSNYFLNFLEGCNDIYFTKSQKDSGTEHKQKSIELKIGKDFIGKDVEVIINSSKLYSEINRLFKSGVHCEKDLIDSTKYFMTFLSKHGLLNLISRLKELNSNLIKKYDEIKIRVVNDKDREGHSIHCYGKEGGIDFLILSATFGELFAGIRVRHDKRNGKLISTFRDNPGLNDERKVRTEIPYHNVFLN